MVFEKVNLVTEVGESRKEGRGVWEYGRNGTENQENRTPEKKDEQTGVKKTMSGDRKMILGTRDGNKISGARKKISGTRERDRKKMSGDRKKAPGKRARKKVEGQVTGTGNVARKKSSNKGQEVDGRDRHGFLSEPGLSSLYTEQPWPRSHSEFQKCQKSS